MNTRLRYLGSAARTIEPRLKLAVLTCMDARVDVYGLLGLRPGDAHVIRNAGGRATEDAIKAVAPSQAVLRTREVMVVHHTGGAVGPFSQNDLANPIAPTTGPPVTEDPGTFTHPAAAGGQD